MEREVGGGIGMGNTCKPLAVSFQCMTKSTTNKKNKKKKEIHYPNRYRAERHNPYKLEKYLLRAFTVMFSLPTANQLSHTYPTAYLVSSPG